MTRRLTALTIVAAILLAILGTNPGPAAATTYYGKSQSDRPPVGYVGGQARDSGNPDAANTYTQRDFAGAPAGSHYNRIDAQFATWATSDASGFFYAASYYFLNGDDFGGYIGLQTRMINCTPTCVNQGHGAVASIWGAIDAYPTPGLPVIAVSDVEIGRPFKSLHFTYPWVAGHVYRTAIIQDETRKCLNCGQMWTAGIVDDSTGVYTVFGRFLLPTNQDRLLPRSVEFSEEYTPNLYATCVIPISRNDWTSSHYLMTGANTPIYSASVINSIQTGTGCTNSAVIPLGAGAYRHVIGALA